MSVIKVVIPLEVLSESYSGLAAVQLRDLAWSFIHLDDWAAAGHRRELPL